VKIEVGIASAAASVLAVVISLIIFKSVQEVGFNVKSSNIHLGDKVAAFLRGGSMMAILISIIAMFLGEDRRKALENSVRTSSLKKLLDPKISTAEMWGVPKKFFATLSKILALMIVYHLFIINTEIPSYKNSVNIKFAPRTFTTILLMLIINLGAHQLFKHIYEEKLQEKEARFDYYMKQVNLKGDQ